MYLIKQIALVEEMERTFIAKEGIIMLVVPQSKLSVWSFWGTAEALLGDNFDFDILPKEDDGRRVRLTYANSYEVKVCHDGDRDFVFFVDKYQPDEIEGYIVFVNSVGVDFSTNGEKIGGKHHGEIVVVLREGQELKITERFSKVKKTAKVVNGQLLLTIA